MLYIKLHHNMGGMILKLCICLFIIYGVVINQFTIFEKSICIFMAILGIIDALKITKYDHVEKVKYEFFDNYFLMYNTEIVLEVEYDQIEKIKSRKDCYLFIIGKIPMPIGRNTFKGITQQELINFIKNKTDIKIK